jgi:dipeptidyl aminopeptidase/acylaminoacyl peptidase
MPQTFPISRYLHVRSATGPAFSPDGRFVAYLCNTTGTPQAWLIPTVGGDPVQLTFGNDAVRSVDFSPTRHELVFSVDAGGNERTQLFHLFGIAGDTATGLGDGWDFADLTRQPRAIHSFGGFSHDGDRIAFAANRDDASRFDIYVQGIREPEARIIAAGPGGYFNAVEWSPDDRQLLAIQTDSNVNQDLYLIDVASGERRHLTPHEGDVQFGSPSLSPDGRTVFCASTAGGADRCVLAAIDCRTGQITRLTTESHEVEAVVASPAAGYVLCLANIEGRSEIQLHDIGNGSVRTPPGLPLGVVSQPIFSRDGSKLAFVLDGPRHNADVWIWDLGADQVRQLTRAGRAGLPFSQFVEPELIHYSSFDGLAIPAWWYPVGGSTDSLPPVIVYPHGGPESQTRPNFSALFQFFLARGYAILAPNVRGSSGYGTRFMNLDNIERRMDSVADLAHATYWLREQRLADPVRIAVYGGSYGGFMVLAAITQYPDLWAAGIDVVGICNFVTFLEKTGAYRRAHREKEYGNLREHREFLESISPIRHVAKIRCPLMVIHGANDPRVPVDEAEQIVAAVKSRGVPVEYLRYEDEGHGLVKLKNRLDAYPRIAAFLDRHLMKK